MYRPFASVVIAGAGTMGAQIAALFLNAGAKVALLDIKSKTGDINAAAQKGWANALKLSPPILTSSELTHHIRLGNIDDNLEWLKEADLFIEAIPEVLQLKQGLLAAIEPYLNSDTVVASNTSGLKISEMLAGRSPTLRRNFLVMHFFNPPRYLQLLELVGGVDTDPQVLKRAAWFAEVYWGKRIVEAKDTPDFIGNRVGVFNLMQCIKFYTEGKFTIEEIDRMRGTLVGCPKSAVFRTADLVGLPVVKANADNLFANLPHDERREVFKLPEVVEQLIARGSIGDKAREGFYKKQGQKIYSLNLTSLEYQEARKSELPGLSCIEKIKSLPERLQALYNLEGPVGDFFRDVTLELLAYCANRIPEIADTPQQIDNALCWGYGWELGPFRIWEELGFERIVDDLQAAGFTLAPWVISMRSLQKSSFYEDSQNSASEIKGIAKKTSSGGFLGLVSRLSPAKPKSATQESIPTNKLTIEQLQIDTSRVIKSWSGGTLYDIGDSVALFSFKSPANVIGFNVVESVLNAIEFIEQSEWLGMVVANSGTNFCLGANLVQVQALLTNPLSAQHLLPGFVAQFQNMAARLTTAQKPIVPFVQGLFLGGGAEFVARCPLQVLHQDAMGGLVEVGVGLIPAGSGTTLMAHLAAKRASGLTPNEVLPQLLKVHEQIAMGSLSTGARGAIDMGLAAPNARIVNKLEDGILAAKYLVLGLAVGYAAPLNLEPIYCLGQDALTALKHRAYVLQQQGLASRHDVLLANTLASILTGGPEHKLPGFVEPKTLLNLEKDSFVALATTADTKARINHMLKTKKPLRN